MGHTKKKEANNIDTSRLRNCYNHSYTMTFKLGVVRRRGLTGACMLRTAELRAERMGMESYTLCDFRGPLKSNDGDLNVGCVTHRIQY